MDVRGLSDCRLLYHYLLPSPVPLFPLHPLILHLLTIDTRALCGRVSSVVSFVSDVNDADFPGSTSLFFVLFQLKPLWVGDHFQI